MANTLSKISVLVVLSLLLILLGSYLSVIYATPNYTRLAQYSAQAATNSAQLQQQQRDVNATSTPFAPLNKVVKQGLNIPKNYQPTFTPQTPTTTQTPLPRHSPPSRPSTPPSTSTKVITTDTGISGLPNNDQQDDNIKFNF